MRKVTLTEDTILYNHYFGCHQWQMSLCAFSEADFQAEAQNKRVNACAEVIGSATIMKTNFAAACHIPKALNNTLKLSG